MGLWGAIMGLFGDKGKDLGKSDRFANGLQNQGAAGVTEGSEQLGWGGDVPPMPGRFPGMPGIGENGGREPLPEDEGQPPADRREPLPEEDEQPPISGLEFGQEGFKPQTEGGSGFDAQAEGGVFDSRFGPAGDGAPTMTDNGEKNKLEGEISMGDVNHQSSQTFLAGDGPVFTKVETADKGAGVVGELSLQMPRLRYIGETSMLLDYVRRLEKLHGVSMPVKACGLDPIVFAEATRGEGEEESGNSFIIKDESEELSYELLSVDNGLYISCMTQCLNEDYLRSVLREATMEVAEHGEYTYYLVGFRELAKNEHEGTVSLIRTLRLNTYELSVLCSYMEQSGAMATYGTTDGRQCIYFKIKS